MQFSCLNTKGSHNISISGSNNDIEISYEKEHITTIQNSITQKSIIEKTWNLPLYPEHYTERPEITKTIWNKFKNHKDKRSTMILAGLHGLGGVGKTTLANEAINKPNNKYSFRGWFNAETKKLLQNEYFELGEKYNLFSNNMLPSQKISAIKDWLAKEENILLVYDNVPDMAMLMEYLPCKGDILITSRNPNLPGALGVDVMTELEAEKLISELLSESTKSNAAYKKDIKELIFTLGYLPLALAQAGAYITTNNILVTEYLSLYTTERDDLLRNEIMPPMMQHAPVYVTWDMSIQKLMEYKNGKEVLKLLELISCCYSERIPKKLMAQYMYKKTDNAAIIKLNNTLSIIRKYSLVKSTTNSVSIHRLVHSWLQDNQSVKQKTLLLKESVAAIETVYQQSDKSIDNLDFIKLLLPHAETILSQLQIYVAEKEYVNLMYILGDSYLFFGNYGRSKELLEQALIIKEKHYGKGHIETVSILTKLGVVHREFGDYAGSKELLERSLIINENHYGSDHIEIAHTLYQLGSTSYYLADFARSKQLLEMALSISEKHYDQENIKIADIICQLGRVYCEFCDYRTSKELLSKALTIRKKYYGSEHIETAYSLHLLGAIYRKLGNYTKSKELLSKALTIRENHYGSDHIEIAYTLLHLGATYRHLGDYIKSKQLLEKSLSIREKYYGEQHIDTSYTLHQLGVTYRYLGDYMKSKELLEKTLSIGEKLYGAYHTDNAFTLHHLGVTYRYLGDYIKSKELLERALLLKANFLKSASYSSLYELGITYHYLGDNVKSKQLIKKALAIKGTFGDF